MAAIYIYIFRFVTSRLQYSLCNRATATTGFHIFITQLGFNALFAFFLNSERFTISTLNAVFLHLLIFQPDRSRSVRAGKLKVVGFTCTLMGSTLYALSLSLTQLIFNKIIKSQTFRSVLNMKSLAVWVPLFAGGGWPSVVREMENFRHGRAAYAAVLIAIAFASQLQAIESVALILQVSSLYSNVVAAVGLPIVPIFGKIFFHENMDGIKVISIILVVWGFTSYVYQHYFHDREIVSAQIQLCVRPAEKSLETAVTLSHRF